MLHASLGELIECESLVRVNVLTGSAQTGVNGGDSAATLDGSSSAVGSAVDRLAAELERASRGAVLAGRTVSARSTSAIGAGGADSQTMPGLSAVDDVNSGPSRTTPLLALREQLHYHAEHGSGAGAADGPLPSDKPVTLVEDCALVEQPSPAICRA